MTKRALVCEDDNSIRALIRTVLRREGFEVDVAVDGREGIACLDRGGYDIVVLDLTMPEVDGYAVVRHLQEHSPNALQHVIITTAASDVVETRFPSTICTVVPKPFDIDTLTRSVRACAYKNEPVHAS